MLNPRCYTDVLQVFIHRNNLHKMTWLSLFIIVLYVCIFRGRELIWAWTHVWFPLSSPSSFTHGCLKTLSISQLYSNSRSCIDFNSLLSSISVHSLLSTQLQSGLSHDFVRFPQGQMSEMSPDSSQGSVKRKCLQCCHSILLLFFSRVLHVIFGYFFWKIVMSLSGTDRGMGVSLKGWINREGCVSESERWRDCHVS